MRIDVFHFRILSSFTLLISIVTYKINSILSCLDIFAIMSMLKQENLSAEAIK